MIYNFVEVCSSSNRRSSTDRPLRLRPPRRNKRLQSSGGCEAAGEREGYRAAEGRGATETEGCTATKTQGCETAKTEGCEAAKTEGCDITNNQ